MKTAILRVLALTLCAVAFAALGTLAEASTSHTGDRAAAIVHTSPPALSSPADSRDDDDEDVDALALPTSTAAATRVFALVTVLRVIDPTPDAIVHRPASPSVLRGPPASVL